MQTEWAKVQEELGFIVSVATGASLCSVLSQLIVLFYYRSLSSLSDDSELSTWINIVFVFLFVLPNIVLNVYSMTGANNCAEALSEECTALIGQAAVDDYGGSNGDEVDPLETDFFLDPEETSARTEFGVDSMRLTLLIERSPCALTLLGRKISWSDVASSFSLLLFSQVLNVLGLGSS